MKIDYCAIASYQYADVVRRCIPGAQERYWRKLWMKYPQKWLWDELIVALPGAKPPSIAFVRAVFRDRLHRKLKRDYENLQRDLLNGNYGELPTTKEVRDKMLQLQQMKRELDGYINGARPRSLHLFRDLLSPKETVIH